MYHVLFIERNKNKEYPYLSEIILKYHSIIKSMLLLFGNNQINRKHIEILIEYYSEYFLPV